MKKVFIERASGEYNSMFRYFGFSTTDDWKVADLVCFTGGSDVHPSFYGHPAHPQTYSDANRDLQCMHIYRSSLELGKPMVGICRGGQFLNVVNGGSMFQDVSGHCRPHKLIVKLRGKEVEVRASSTHHQMMRPHYSADLIGWGEKGTCDSWTYWDGGGWTTDYDREENNEVIFYKETRSLCFQPHPEFPEFPDLRDVFQELIAEHLDGDSLQSGGLLQ